MSRSTSIDDYPVGTVVLWEASPHGSRFTGRVVDHIEATNYSVLRIIRKGGGVSIVPPQSVIAVAKDYR